MKPQSKGLVSLLLQPDQKQTTASLQLQPAPDQKQTMAPTMKKRKRRARIHDDLIIGILARLPLKFIVRFRRLSKYWNALLTSPSFIRTHLNYVKESESNSMHRLILSSTYTLQSMRYGVCESCKLNFPRIYPKRRRFLFEILGSCNGLLCLVVSRKTLILWNPSIREFKKLPLSCPLSNNKINKTDTFGFGYDYSTDDYKLIRFVHVIDGIESSYIYSLKSNTWKRIQGFSVSIKFFEDLISGTFVNGVLYWNIIYPGKIIPWILRFNLTSEKFETLSPPNDVNKGHDFALREIGGCLTLAQNLEGRSIEMWKLEKDNTKQGWTKFMTIMNLQTLPYPHDLVPICFMKNGEVLITYGKNVAFLAIGRERSRFELYDPRTSTFRRLQVCGISRWSQAIPYTKSLVSPKLLMACDGMRVGK
ncbi:F-box protein CPR30-like [Herrania umbratica]|uniref:F-box protein CPR30-like n=1 Tax=Herrania umbratica TaxID=108875 RepID=A0A6J1AUS1_9ROSI|nr:F-box protein CPR30-like [Herrania umbratica]